jgi:predicted permease
VSEHLRTLNQDIRRAAWQFRRTPVFACVALLTLAVGVGANIALFLLLDALVWRALPIRDPKSLVALSGIVANGQSTRLVLPLFAEMTANVTSLATVSAYLGNGSLTTVANGLMSRSAVDGVTGEYYQVLGLSPHVGRLIARSDVGLTEGVPANVVVLGYDFWQRQYGGDPRVVGKALLIEGAPFMIIGVTPRSFLGLQVGIDTDLTIPITSIRRVVGLPPDWPIPVSRVIGRLQTGVSIEQARANVEMLWPALLRRSVPPSFTPEQREEFLATRVTVASATTGFSNLRDRFVRPLTVLLSFTGWMLLITCVNLSGLLLARAAARQQEFSVRLALGASRGRLFRQLLTESGALSLVGTALGLPIAWWCARAFLAAMSSAQAPLPIELSPDWRVVAFIAGVAIATGLVVGAVPGWTLTRRMRAALEPARTTTHGPTRWGEGLLVAQVALAVVLLAGTGLFVRTFASLRGRDVGFQRDGVLLAHAFPQPGGYRDVNDGVYYRELVERLSTLPGVQSVALSKSLPAGGADKQLTQPVGLSHAVASARDLPATLEFVSPGFFETMGISLLEGRDLRWNDDLQSAPVTIVSATLARELFTAGGAVGGHIRVGTEPRHRRMQVVGVASDASISNVRSPDRRAVFAAWSQQPPPFSRWPVLEIRSTGNAAALVPSVRRTVESLGHEYVENFRSLEDQVILSLGRERMLATLAAFFGILAALLVSFGLYGHMAYAVARRTREIGVRMSLGATARSVRTMIVARSLRVTAIGIAVGLPCAGAVTSMLQRYVDGLVAEAPLAFLDGALLLLLVAAVAAYGPARRASRVQPIEALRDL